MKSLFGALLGVTAMVALLPAPATAAEEIFCGRILGYSAATATAHGSFVIAERGPQTLVGTYIVIPQGRAFVAFVASGAPGYRAEPTPAPTPASSPRAIGSLPSTSTASVPIAEPRVGVLSLIAFIGACALWRRYAAG